MPKRLKKIKIKVPEYFDFKNFEDIFLKKEICKKVPLGKKGNIYEFDLTEVMWVDLMEIMSLAISADHIFNETGCESIFSFSNPQHCKSEIDEQRNEVVDFIQRMDFPELLLTKKIESNIGPSGVFDETKFLGITTLNYNEFSKLQQLIRGILKHHYGEWLEPAQIHSFIDRLVYEACENVFEHAYDKGEQDIHTSKLVAIRIYKAATKSESMRKRAWYSTQWVRELQRLYPKKDVLEIVVADGGVGINKRLGKVFQTKAEKWAKGEGREAIPADFTELKCLKWALSKDRSSSSELPFKGYGLYIIKMYCVKGWGGCFYIRSGNSKAIYMGDDDVPISQSDGTLESFPGVQMRLFLPIIDRKKEIKEIKELDDKLKGE